MAVDDTQRDPALRGARTAADDAADLVAVDEKGSAHTRDWYWWVASVALVGRCGLWDRTTKLSLTNDIRYR